MFRLFECCALSFFERFVLSFSLKIERFVSDSAEIWICGLYVRTSLFHTQGKSYYSLQPRLSARYDLGQGYSAKASYTCMAQYVHLLSSTPLSMPTDLWVPITKDISPMYANQFSIGGYYSGLPGWEFSVEGYYKQMKHILEYQDGVSFFGTSTNWEEK